MQAHVRFGSRCRHYLHTERHCFQPVIIWFAIMHIFKHSKWLDSIMKHVHYLNPGGKKINRPATFIQHLFYLNSLIGVPVVYYWKFDPGENGVWKHVCLFIDYHSDPPAGTRPDAYLLLCLPLHLHCCLLVQRKGYNHIKVRQVRDWRCLWIQCLDESMHHSTDRCFST